MTKGTLALALSATLAGTAVLKATALGVLGPLGVVAGSLISAGTLLAAAGMARGRRDVAAIGGLLGGVGSLAAGPGIFAASDGWLQLKLDAFTASAIGIGGSIAGLAAILIGTGKLMNRRRAVEFGYALYGLGATTAGGGCVKFGLFRDGAKLSLADPGSALLVAGIVGGLGFGVIAAILALLAVFGRGPIHLPPGVRLRGVLAKVYSSTTYGRVFEPILADALHEWAEAQRSGDYWHARWIRVRVYLLIGQAAALQLPFSVLRLLAAFWKVGL